MTQTTQGSSNQPKSSRDYLRKAILALPTRSKLDPIDLKGLEKLTIIEPSETRDMTFMGTAVASVYVDNNYNLSTDEYGEEFSCFNLHLSNKIPTGATHYYLGGIFSGSYHDACFDGIGPELRRSEVGIYGVIRIEQYKNAKGERIDNLHTKIGYPIAFFKKE